MGTAVVGNDVKTIEQQDTRSHNSIFQQRKGFASNLYKKKAYQEAGKYVHIMRKGKCSWLLST